MSLEDTDVAFHHTVNREPLNEAEAPEAPESEPMGPNGGLSIAGGVGDSSFASRVRNGFARGPS